MGVALTGEIITVLVVLVVVIGLFITEIVRVDVVAIIMMVVLPMLGLVTTDEAFSGFSSNAVISIIAVIIIGAGLDKTGVMNKVAAPVISICGGSVTRLVAGVSATVAIISSFMQNIGAAALFLPVTMRVSKQLNIPLSKILMPMGFCAILGGTVTLVGCSPLILLNDLLANSGLEPFGLFSVTPIGLMLVTSGILYFSLFGRFVLPSRTVDGEDTGGALNLLKRYGTVVKIYELSASSDFKHAGKTLAEFQFKNSFLVTVVAIAQSGVENIAISPTRSHRINANDILAVLGHERNVRKLAKQYGFVLKEELEYFREELSSNFAGVTEAIVPPHSPLLGETLRESNFAYKNNISPVILYRNGMVFRAGLSDIPLKPGDALLLYGSWNSFAKISDSPDLLLTSRKQELFEVEKASAALICFAIAIFLVLFRDTLGLPINLSVCLMTGALLMILTKVLSVDQAYRSVDWRTVFLLAGLIPLGVATEKSGTAAYMAHNALMALGEVTPIVLLTVIAILSTIFTLVISNVGATVLLVPLAINMALEAGADPRMAALVVGLATSNSFLLPTHQVNALLMGPGGYTSIDYMKAGSGMTIIFIVITVFGLWLFYGIGG